VERARRIDLGTQRSTREILAGAWSLYRSYPLLFAVLALGVMAPWNLAVLAVTGHGPLHSGHEAFPTALILTLLRYALVGPLISALHIHAVVQIGAGERPRLSRVAVRGLRVLPVVAATDLVATALTFGGLLLLVVPGVIALLMLAVSSQAASLEGRGWIGALRSSRDLTDDHYGHVFPVLLWPALLAVAALTAAQALPLGSPTGGAAVAVGIAVETATVSFAALTLALLYFDLKTRAALPVSAVTDP
jgi:hypothetical protein